MEHYSRRLEIGSGTMTEVLGLGFVGAMALAIFGGLMWIITTTTREAERNKVNAELEHDAAEKLRKANEIVASHTDADELDRVLRDGGF
jgi:hypothetical protein